MKVDKYLKTYIEQVFKRDEEYIPLKKDDFLLFSKTGDRLTYEHKYFAGRKALTCKALRLLLVPERCKPGDMEALLLVIKNILAEPVWCLPAHCKPEAFDTGEYGIDLFAAETAGSLAEILGSSKALCEEEQVFSKYREEIDALSAGFLERFNYHVGKKWEAGTCGFEKGRDNWTSVCSGNVGLAYFYLWKLGFVDAETLRKNIDRVLAAMGSYLSGFKDGCCMEGIGYYNYGMAYLLAFLEKALETDSSKTDEIISKFNKSQISKFIPAVYLGQKNYLAFSDATGCKTDLGLYAYLSKFDSELTLSKDFWDEEGNLCTDGAEILGGDECGRFALALREYEWVKKYGGFLRTESRQEGQKYYLFDKSEWYIAHIQTGEVFAFKGGSNNEPHNHNDVGSFVYAVDGVQVLAELGAGEYTADYFGKDRYRYLATSSEGHSVPCVESLEQQAGSACGAFDCSRVSAGILKKDIGLSYGLEEGSLIRTVKAEFPTVEITDTLEKHPEYALKERLISFIEPGICENTASFAVKEGRVEVSFTNCGQISCKRLSYNAHDGKETPFYCITAKKKDGAKYAAIRIKHIVHNEPYFAR